MKSRYENCAIQYSPRVASTISSATPQGHVLPGLLVDRVSLRLIWDLMSIWVIWDIHGASGRLLNVEIQKDCTETARETTLEAISSKKTSLFDGCQKVMLLQSCFEVHHGAKAVDMQEKETTTTTLREQRLP
jgi:hypothetical protein